MYPAASVPNLCFNHMCHSPLPHAEIHAVQLYKIPSMLHHQSLRHAADSFLPILSTEAVGTLQLLHQLNVILLGCRRSDLVFDSDFLPCIVLVLLLCATAKVSQDSS